MWVSGSQIIRKQMVNYMLMLQYPLSLNRNWHLLMQLPHMTWSEISSFLCNNMALIRCQGTAQKDVNLNYVPIIIVSLKQGIYFCALQPTAVMSSWHARLGEIAYYNCEYANPLLRKQSISELPDSHNHLLLGFVRTRVLMSRSRLNNGATHGGWHFDIHRDFNTRGC